ncbi:MAG: Fic family protein [Prevotella sp.]|nr:Fic family protein [Staphylococcus sp.]MCM1350094.1 Fic family protein [Prevotella sp.]
MAYKSLYKLYVMNDNSTFEAIYKEKLNSNSTIKFDLYMNDYQAFFNYDRDIMSLVANIREMDSKIHNIFSNLPHLVFSQYMRKSLIDEIESTNQIEGVISTRKDINDLIYEIEKKAQTRNRFEGIVKKYLMLTEEKIKFADSHDIRKLYNEMLYNEIKSEDVKNLPDGKIFRKDIVHIYKTGEKIVHNGLMPEAKIIDYMDKTINILNDSSIDILIRVALFHYLFGYIHPFYDGNGRMNRFISSYTLSKYFHEVIGFRLSMSIKENLSQYLDAFAYTNDIRNRADLSTFVYEFLDIIHKSYVKTEIYALEKKQIFEKYKTLLTKINLFENHKNNEDIKALLFILVQTSIFGDFGMSKNGLCKILKKGNTKTTEFLSELRKYNLCSEVTSGKNHYYKANLEELDNYYNG